MPSRPYLRHQRSRNGLVRGRRGRPRQSLREGKAKRAGTERVPTAGVSHLEIEGRGNLVAGVVATKRINPCGHIDAMGPGVLKCAIHVAAIAECHVVVVSISD